MPQSPVPSPATAPQTLSACPAFVVEVVVFAQADEPGIIGVHRWLAALPESTRIFIPDIAGKDWADVLNALTPAEARETLQQHTPFTREQFLSLDPARYPIPPIPATHHPNLDVPFMLRVHEAVQHLQSRSVAAILVFLGMEKNNSNRLKTKKGLKNMDKYNTEIGSGYFK